MRHQRKATNRPTDRSTQDMCHMLINNANRFMGATSTNMRCQQNITHANNWALRAPNVPRAITRTPSAEGTTRVTKLA